MPRPFTTRNRRPRAPRVQPPRALRQTPATPTTPPRPWARNLERPGGPPANSVGAEWQGLACPGLRAVPQSSPSAGAELLRERLEQLPADRRVALDERAEVPEGEAPADQLARGGDRGRARALVDQGDLAEVVAGPERRARLAADRDRGLTRLDHEERRPAGALLATVSPSRKRRSLNSRATWPDLALVQVGEERDALQDSTGAPAIWVRYLPG